jgi:hypothetical protein
MQATGPSILPFSELSPRAENALERLGIVDADGLRRLSPVDLAKAPNCGRKTVNEIIVWAKSFGVKVGAATSGQLEFPPAQLKKLESVLPELLLKVSDFNLSVRATRSLAARGVRRLGDLVLLTEESLLKQKNCGRRTVKELKDFVGGFGLTLGMEVPAWSEDAAVALARTNAATVARIRREFQEKAYPVDSTNGLESEVASALTLVTKPENVSKVEAWIGLARPTPATLEEIGLIADVTREYIRQIVAGAQKRAAKLHLPVLSAAIERLGAAGALTETSAQDILMSEGLARTRVSSRGLLRAAEFFGIASELRVEKVASLSVLGSESELASVSLIERAGRRAVELWGCSTIDEVSAQVSEGMEEEVSPALVRDVLRLDPAFEWLEEAGGWFWLRDLLRNRVLNRIDKILAVAPRIDLATLRSGVSRHHRMEGFAPPTKVLRTLCSRLPDCEVISGEFVVDRRPRLPLQELSDQERRIVAVFQKYGPALTYAEARERCIADGINEYTTNVYLNTNPIIRRVASGVYCIIGAQVAPGDVQEKAKTVIRGRGRKSRIVQDSGWSEDGKSLWATLKISEGFLRSGVVGVPTMMKPFVTGHEFRLRGTDGAQIGQIRAKDGSMWGFLPFFRRRGGEPGDFMKLTLKLEDQTATIELSDQAFDDLDPTGGIVA